MIRSMTGFGEAHREVSGAQYTLELRSVNHRYFKFSTRLPEELQSLEPELETELRKRFARGSFSAALRLRLLGTAATSDVNDGALLGYLEHLEAIRRRLGDEEVSIDLTQLLTLPGVLEPAGEAAQQADQARPVVLALLAQAAERLDHMRSAEGEQLTAELRRQHHRLAAVTEQISQRAPVVVEEYHGRLLQRVRTLTDSAELRVDASDLLKEVAVFADRADIAEEVARLRSHLEQFETLLASDPHEPAGRTLDFLTQEMLRECNTIGAKSNDTQISRCVVEAKSLVDRLKEQVQNVE